jgi:5-methylcytosine-specific restriction endonuclease McrA
VVQVDGEERYKSHDLSSWVGYSSENAEAEMIHAARIAICAPKVLVLSIYDRLPRLDVKFTRRNVFLRDHFTCQYCTKVLPEAQLNLDHVTPRDKGGRTTWDNIVTSCFRCNTRKGNKLPHEANMHPQNPPLAPRWRPLYGMHENGLAHESWSHFLHSEKGESLRSA